MRHGFTLFEMMVALVLLAIISGVTGLALLAAPAKDGAAQLLAELRTARTRAVTSGHMVTWHGVAETLRFFPDGSSSGGTIVDSVIVSVGALDGRARASR